MQNVILLLLLLKKYLKSQTHSLLYHRFSNHIPCGQLSSSGIFISPALYLNPLYFSDEDFMPLTWTQNLQGRSVIFLHPLFSIIQQQAYRRRCSIKLINFQSLHHFPVTTWKITNWLFTLPALTLLQALSWKVNSQSWSCYYWEYRAKAMTTFFSYPGFTDAPDCCIHVFQSNGAYLSCTGRSRWTVL